MLGQIVGPPIRRSSWFANPNREIRPLMWVTLIGVVVLAVSLIALIVERGT